MKCYPQNATNILLNLLFFKELRLHDKEKSSLSHNETKKLSGNYHNITRSAHVASIILIILGALNIFQHFVVVRVMQITKTNSSRYTFN